MTLATPRLALPYPQLFDVDNVPASMLALATALDNKMVGFTQGTFAARPSGGSVYGKWYYATDTAQLFQYLPADANATAGWRLIGTLPTMPTARWHSSTQQLVSPPSGNAYDTPMQIAWSYGPGSGFGGTWPNLFDGVTFSGLGWGPGPTPTVPTPGIYRIHGQVSFLHCSPYIGGNSYRQTAEQYAVQVFRKGQFGVASLCYEQETDEFVSAAAFSYPFNGYPTVEFSCLASFDLTSAAQSGIEVWVGSSVPAPGTIYNTVIQQVNGGSSNTFLEMDYVCAI